MIHNYRNFRRDLRNKRFWGCQTVLSINNVDRIIGIYIFRGSSSPSDHGGIGGLGSIGGLGGL